MEPYMIFMYTFGTLAASERCSRKGMSQIPPKAGLHLIAEHSNNNNSMSR